MNTKIPPLDLRAELQEIGPELKNRAIQVLKSGRYILGNEVQEFEKNFTHFTGSKYTIGVASGSDALLLALMALDVQKGDEIITTPFSFIASATAIARLGAKPVFVDIDPMSFNLNPALIKKKITSRTKGIIPVHLYGNPCDMDQIMKIAKKTGLFVIEDCAQACGSTFHGKSVGTFGDIGAFSFYPTKTLGAAGDAGAVTTNQTKLYEKIKSLRQHGEDGKFHSYRHPLIGMNSRLDEIQATVLNVKLKHLKKWNDARRKAAKRYNKLFSGTSSGRDRFCFKVSTKNLSRNGTGTVELVLPTETPGGKSVFHQYTIRTPKRDKLLAYLKQNGISANVYYPYPLHLQKCFQYLGYRKGDFPIAEKASRQALSLPLFPQLKLAQQERIVNIISQFNWKS